jgi:hypothetical protein
MATARNVNLLISLSSVALSLALSLPLSVHAQSPEQAEDSAIQSDKQLIARFPFSKPKDDTADSKKSDSKQDAKKSDADAKDKDSKEDKGAKEKDAKSKETKASDKEKSKDVKDSSAKGKDDKSRDDKAKEDKSKDEKPKAKAKKKSAEPNTAKAPIFIPDSALISVLKDLSRSLKETEEVAKLEDPNQKAVVDLAQQVLQKAVEAPNLESDRIVHGDKSKLPMTAEAWASGNVVLPDNGHGSLAAVWAKHENGLFNVTIAGNCPEKLAPNGMKVGEFLVLLNGRSTVQSGFDIQSQANVSFWLGKLSAIVVESDCCRASNHKSEKEGASGIEKDKEAAADGTVELKKNSIVVLQALLTEREREYQQQVADFERGLAPATKMASKTEGNAHSAALESKPAESKTSVTTETKATESTTSAPSQTKVAESTTSTPSQTKATESTTSAPSQTKATESTTSAPSQTKATESTTSAPSQTKATESTTSTPSQTKVAESATSTPSQTKATESTTSAPSQTKVAESTTSTPSQTKATESTTSAPSQTKVAESTTSIPSQTKVAESTTSTPPESKVAESSTAAPGWDAKPAESKSAGNQATWSPYETIAQQDKWPKSTESQTLTNSSVRQLQTQKGEAPKSPSWLPPDTLAQPSSEEKKIASIGNTSAATPPATPTTDTTSKPVSSGWESPAANVVTKCPSNSATLHIPGKAIAGQFLTASVMDANHNGEAAVELSFNGASLLTDNHGQAVFLVPEDATPGRSLAIGLAMRPEVKPGMVDIFQPLMVSSSQETPKIDQMSAIASPGGPALINGHNFDGLAEHNRVLIDNAHECKILAASAVQMKFMIPDNVQPGVHTITVTANGLKSNSVNFDAVGVEVRGDPREAARDLMTKLIVRITGTDNKVSVHFKNNSPDVIKLVKGNEFALTSPGGVNNSFVLAAQRLKKGTYRLDAFVE